MAAEKKPYELGYSMPAEWEAHRATWISWPKNQDSFPEEILGEVERSYIEMVKNLQENETVHILVDDDSYEKRVREFLEYDGSGMKKVILHRIKTADVWFRDYGPIFVRNNATRDIALTNWHFNAWGNKYDDLKEDDGIPDRLPIGAMMRFNPQIVLEGGSIDMNGLGTCLTTEQCLLNSNRNPQLGKEEIGKYLLDYLGARNIIWLKRGIEGDDTDGHVDDIARFVSKDTVVCAYEENENDANYSALKSNFDILSSAKDQDGNSFKIVKLPMPKPVELWERRLPASYTNFYIANKTVIVPIFGDDNDRKALDILQSLFKGRKVVGINCKCLVYGFGAIHCVTQQQPE